MNRLWSWTQHTQRLSVTRIFFSRILWRFLCSLFVVFQYCQITKPCLCGKWQIWVIKVLKKLFYHPKNWLRPPPPTPQPHPCAVPGRRTLLKYKKSTDNVTRDDSQRRFLTQHSVAALLRLCSAWLQHCTNIATLCCTKNRRCLVEHRLYRDSSLYVHDVDKTCEIRQ